MSRDKALYKSTDTSYMADHRVNVSTKFEDPMAIRYWVMSSDISHGNALAAREWFLATAHAPYHRDLCVYAGKFSPDNWNPWPQFVLTVQLVWLYN